MTVQEILLNYSNNKRNLLPAIKAVVEEAGAVSEETAGLIANYFELTRAEVLSAATFCEEAKANKQPELVIRVCDGVSCATNGSEETFKQIESFLEQREKNGGDPKVSLERVGCFGQCPFGPNVQIGQIIYGKVFSDKVADLLKGYFDFS